MSCDIIDIPIVQIERNIKQPRRHFNQETIKELAQTVKSIGLVHHITVSPIGNDRYKIVQGERRYLACKEAGVKSIKAIVISEKEVTPFISLIENLQRENLLPIEEAMTYRQILETEKITQSELAEKIGKTQSYIAQKLRLVKLPSSVMILLNKGALSEGHARQLLRLEDIIEGLVTTDFKKSDFRIPEHDRFNNWTEYYQDYFAWHYSDKTVNELEEAIDRFYCDLGMATFDRYENINDYLPKVKRIFKKYETEKYKDKAQIDNWTPEEQTIMHDFNQCVFRERFKPEIKRDKDIKFMANYIIKHSPPLPEEFGLMDEE